MQHFIRQLLLTAFLRSNLNIAVRTAVETMHVLMHDHNIMMVTAPTMPQQMPVANHGGFFDEVSLHQRIFLQLRMNSIRMNL